MKGRTKNAHLKNEFMEDEKNHNLMTWLITENKDLVSRVTVNQKWDDQRSIVNIFERMEIFFIACNSTSRKSKIMLIRQQF